MNIEDRLKELSLSEWAKKYRILEEGEELQDIEIKKTSIGYCGSTNTILSLLQSMYNTRNDKNYI